MTDADRDALIATEWMGWVPYLHGRRGEMWMDPATRYKRAKPGWSPSTSPADAIEALVYSGGMFQLSMATTQAFCSIWLDDTAESMLGTSYLDEAAGDKGLALARAISLAIEAALKARENQRD